MLDKRLRNFFPYLRKEAHIKVSRTGGRERIAFDNAASSQIPVPVLEALMKGVLDYANVHRSGYEAARNSTIAMESTYNLAANLINAPSWQEIVFGMNTTHMINLVALGIQDQLRDGDNIVITELEHSSNAGPWIGLVNTLSKRSHPVKVDLRLASFDVRTGELDYDHLSSLVDEKTKIVSCTGASNFLGVRPDLYKVAEIASRSGYVHPYGKKGSLFLIDAAQLIPGSPINVRSIGCDFLSWSSHKMCIPLGIGGLYARKDAMESLDRVLHGGGMYTDLYRERECWREHPWDMTAGTQSILSIISFGEGIRFLINGGLGNLPPDEGSSHEEKVEATGRIIAVNRLLARPAGGFPHPYAVPEDLSPLWQEFTAGHPDEQWRFATDETLRNTVEAAMNNIKGHLREITSLALEGLMKIPGVTIYGPLDAEKRGALVAFTVKGLNSADVGMKLSEYGIETRWGHHCAYFAHDRYGIKTAGSVRMSFYLYNTPEEVAYALEAVNRISRAAGNS